MFARDGIRGVCKEPVILKKEGDIITPLMYFRRAKSASEQEYNDVVNFVKRKLENE